MKPQLKKIRAFTLLEVLASFSIVTLVILGPLTFSINSASFSGQSKDLMVSVYLAQEAIELLHYQYDTLYIACANDMDACNSLVETTLPGESSGDKAWRLFKTRLANVTPPNVSCFSSSGCTYDFLEMLNATSTTPPKRYSPIASTCQNLSLVYASSTNQRNYYVCSSLTVGSPSLKDSPYKIKNTSYSRKVVLVSKSTFDEGSLDIPNDPNSAHYQDDVVITSSVSFRRFNGVTRTVKVTDFMHARS